MFKYKEFKIGKKLLLSFLFIGVTPLIVFACVGLISMYNASIGDAKSQLESIRVAKYNQIETFFNEREDEAETLAKILDTLKKEGENQLEATQKYHKLSVENYLEKIEALVVNEGNADQLKLMVTALNRHYADGSGNYSGITKAYNDRLTTNPLMENVNDLYVISNEGKLIYAYQGSENLGVDLGDTFYQSYGLANLWQNVIDDNALCFEDFTKDGMTGDAYNAFLGLPVYENGKRIGVVAVSFDNTTINQLVHDENALGDSMETYIAANDNGDMVFKSDMTTMGDGNYTIGHKMDSPPNYVKLTFLGKSINEIFKDSEENMVVVSSDPIQVFDQQWIMVSKVELKDLIAVNDENGGDYFSNYVQDHSYKDIFLIHPDGYVFYSATEGFEYNKNLLQGEYSSTNHAQLIRDIKERKAFAFVDYEASELSNYEPRAFMGIPVFDLDHQIEFIVSFEMSSDAVNEIMLDRTGLGNYGEAYLLGPDFRLRSNTYLAPLTKNIVNSFKNADEGGIFSEVAFSVLSGETDTVIKHDYRDTSAIISYEPIMIYGQQWGLVVKQDTSERLKHLNLLVFYMMVLGLLTTIGIVFFARRISASISKPVVAISEWAKDVSNGGLAFEEIETYNDEIGEMKDSVFKVVESLNSVAEICEEIAIGKLDHPFIVRSDHDRLGESINTMRHSFIQVIQQANAISQSDYSVSINKRSEDDELGIALINMVTQLKEASEIAITQSWIKNGQSKLNEIIRDTDNNQQLCKDAVAFICKYLDANTGVMLVKNDDAYAMLGSYAFNIRHNDHFKVAEGEGVIGQAILEKEVIYLKDIPNDLMTIESASVDIKATHVIVIPCLFEDDVKGVIEIGSYTPFTEHHIEFLNKIQENIAIAIHSNITREELQALLDQTLIQSEELKKSEQVLMVKNEELSQQTEALRESESKLQQQQEELRQSNEELEAQTMELKASESKLQQQQEELRVTNEELEEKTINLQKQKEEIVKKNDALEKTKAIIEEKVKEVEISSKYKSEFLANMSHELRTPLNSILILSGFLVEDKNGLLGKDEKEYAKVINAAGKDLLDLINDILDLSKIESGKMELTLEAFDIRKTLLELQEMFKPLVDEKGLNFINTVEDSVPKMIVSDEMKISQVMKNLISNAIKFTQEGDVEIKASITTNNQLQIAVRDTGIGISKDKLLHIFGAFQQADGSTSRNYGGTGLGLSISKELARLLGGDIKLESEEGKGSTFYIYIPINDKALESEEAHQTQEDQIAVFEDVPEMDAMTEVYDKNEVKLNVELPSEYESVILIIEDDKNFASILEKVAKERGHDVVCVDSGEQALLVADRIDVSAIILDLGLPGMSGWEVLQRLKKWKKTQDIPVHIMSGKELDHQHSELEFIDYLQKPISFDKLYGAFDQIEKLIRQDIKKLLLVTSDNSVADEIETEFNKTLKDIKLKRVTTGDEVISVLKERTYDCIVMVSDLVDTSMEELAKKIRINDISQTPIILYMKKELPNELNDELARYVESIIIAGDKSMRRLIDESTLFLNHVEETHREKVHEFMKTSSEKEAILVDKTVLIVDDDMRNTFALSSVLEDRGMKVIIAKNGQAGIDKLKENPSIDIVLMDIMMPVMDGYTAMRKIRSMKESFSKVPIIALTAKAMREDKEKCISAGASDYLAKPIKMDELQTLMKVWIY